jgi:hypothetical protein
MHEHEEIQDAFRHFKEARKVFAKYKNKWFSGNDNHVGDVGEYWAMRYFEKKHPELAPKRTSPYDIQLEDGTRFSIKTMSKWNESGQGGPIKGINEKHWDYLIAIKLDEDLAVEEFCIVPRKELVKMGVSDRSPFKWWSWLEDYGEDYQL